MKTFRLQGYGRNGTRILHMFCPDPVRVGMAVDQQCQRMLAGGEPILLMLEQVEMHLSEAGLEVASASSWEHSSDAA